MSEVEIETLVTRVKDHCYSIHFDVKQLLVNLCVQRQYNIPTKHSCQNMHCTHT